MELGDELAVPADDGLAEGNHTVDGGGADDLREGRVQAEELTDEFVEVGEGVEVLAEVR